MAEIFLFKILKCYRGICIDILVKGGVRKYDQQRYVRETYSLRPNTYSEIFLERNSVFRQQTIVYTLKKLYMSLQLPKAFSC